jgi:hypothetical protein
MGGWWAFMVALRVQVRLDLAQGGMQGPWLQEGRAAERSGEAREAPLPQGCLYNVDAGYFTLAEMRAHGQAGCYWLRTANAGTPLIDERGQCWDLVSFLRAQTGEEVDVQVLLGKYERLPVRLIARRVSAEQAERRRKSANREKEVKAKGVQRPNVRKRRGAGDKRKRTRKRKKTGKARLQLLDWTILITSVPQELLSIDEALVLARCRWQIELLWKLWKQIGKVDTWRSAKPYRILTELYAKLSGCLITHWLTLLECWQAPNRSMVKARQVVQWMAPVLALGRGGRSPTSGDDGAAHLVHHGLWLYRQCPSQEACGLSTRRASEAHPGLRLMPIGGPQGHPWVGMGGGSICRFHPYQKSHLHTHPRY